MNTALLLCLGEILSMTGFAAFPSFLPQLRSLWGISGVEAGFVGGSFFMGYMLGVPFLSGATDRIDARRVFSLSCLLVAAGILGFAFLAQGMWSGALFQIITGAGLSGTYMPGLKALADRVKGPEQPRFVAFYTASFGVGTSLSLLLAGTLNRYLSLQTAFACLALGPLLAGMMIMLLLEPITPPQTAIHRHWWPQWRPVFKDHKSRLFIWGYAAHCWELFGIRSWMVAFFAFSFGLGARSSPLSPTEATALVNLFGLFTSIFGNEMAGRVGRVRWIRLTMLGSASLCALAGLSGIGPWWLTILMVSLYFSLVMADSAALTAGLVAVTEPARQGATLAVYSLLGFGCGFISPMVFGWVLDVFSLGATGWTLAFVSLTVGGLIWGIKMRRYQDKPLQVS